MNKFILLLASFLTTTSVLAQTAISVSPTQLSMEPLDKKIAQTLIIRNASKDTVTLQALVYSWSQDEKGEFILTPTEDVLALPSTFKVSPTSTKKIRVVHKKENLPEAGSAKFYRILVKELPKLEKQQEQLQLKFTVGFSIPLFVTNKYESKQPELTASLIDNLLTVKNTGANYLKANEIKAGELRVSNLTYVLPGNQVQLQLADDAKAFLSSNPLTVIPSEGEPYNVKISP